MIAALARDCEWQVKGVVVKCLDVVGPLDGEVEAVKLGVQLACDQGFPNVILEGDFKIVIKAIHTGPQILD